MKFTSKHIKLVTMNQYKLVHIDTENIIVFIIMYMKLYYDKAHQSHFFNVSDAVNLHLHCEYILSSLTEKK